MNTPSASDSASASREDRSAADGDDVEVRGFKAQDDLTVPGKCMKVELDKLSLFALASDTRLDILKSLQPNRRTVSQLAELLKIDKAAVHRHLKKLEQGGFVHRDEDHGFVYYGLTWKSRGILSPTDNTRIVILLSASVLCVLAIAAFIITSYALAPASDAAPALGMMPASTAAEDPVSTSLTSALYPAAPIAVLGLAAFALLYSAYCLWKRPRQKRKAGAEDRSEDDEHIDERSSAGGPRSA